VTFRGSRDRKRFDVRDPDLHARSHRGKWTRLETLERRAGRRIDGASVRGAARNEEIDLPPPRSRPGRHEPHTVPLARWSAGQLEDRVRRTGWNLLERRAYCPCDEHARRYAAIVRAVAKTHDAALAAHFRGWLEGVDFGPPNRVLLRVLAAQPALDGELRGWIRRVLEPR
jgi:hypothetical protein